ncbi:MAG: hypothetical protein ACJAS1_005728, partial [Oleiphilaceae bacterium]
MQRSAPFSLWCIAFNAEEPKNKIFKPPRTQRTQRKAKPIDC